MSIFPQKLFRQKSLWLWVLWLLWLLWLLLLLLLLLFNWNNILCWSFLQFYAWKKKWNQPARQTSSASWCRAALISLISSCVTASWVSFNSAVSRLDSKCRLSLFCTVAPLSGCGELTAAWPPESKQRGSESRQDRGVEFQPQYW